MSANSGAGSDRSIDLYESSVGHEDQHRQNRTDDDESRARSDALDESRGCNRAQCDTTHRESPNDPEDAREDLIRDDSLEQGEDGDILDAVGSTDNRKQEDRRREIGPGGDECDRHSPRHEREAEGDSKSSPSKRHRSDCSDQATNSDGGCHVADRFCTCIEDLECGDDDQDIEAAADEGLRNDQGHDQAGSWAARNRSKPGRKDLSCATLVVGGRSQVNAAFDSDPREENCGQKKPSGADGEDESDVHNRDEYAGEQGSKESPQAFDRRGCTVRSDELGGSSRERRQQSLQRGPDESGCEPDQSREGVNEEL